MSTTKFIHASLALLAGLALTPAVVGQNCDCEQGCCPPCIKYQFEGPPRLKFKHGCPKPICDPCRLPHFGYYQTCWQPWPFPPNWDHCPVPPPAALVQPVPPKRFRGEVVPDGKERRELDPAPIPRPLDKEKGKEDGSSSLLPLEAPSVNPMPAVRTEPSPLPADPVNQTSLREPISLRNPGRMIESMPKAEDAATLPAPAPLPSPLLMAEPAPSLLPTPPVEKPADAAPTPPAEKPAARTPYQQQSIKPDEAVETPATPFPTPAVQAFASRNTEPQRPRTAATGNAAPLMKMVNSRRVMLDYDLADVPAPERSMLELWYTQDSHSWFKDQTQVKTGAPYVVEVNKEGTYGFMMVARQPGEKSLPPTPGEAPQVWVEVDWTRPVVHLVDVKPGMAASGRSVSIVWTATDNNLGRSPITLSYAEAPAGPWKTFAAGLENVGRYVWQVPNNLPGQVYLRVEASDLVGNAGAAQTPAAVQLP